MALASLNLWPFRLAPGEGDLRVDLAGGAVLFSCSLTFSLCVEFLCVDSMRSPSSSIYSFTKPGDRYCSRVSGMPVPKS